MSDKPLDNVVSHWATLVDDFDTSGQDFFRDIEARVADRKVPNVTVSRVEFKESGLLSDKRVYLRLQRDDLIFDVGAAPYGTGFFFSWWLVRRAPRFAWVYTIGFFLVAGFVATTSDGGLLLMLFSLLVGCAVAFGLLALLGKFEVLGPEAHIAQAPLIGGLYTRLFAPATYHSLDLVSMYQESIRRAVNDAVDHALKAQGRAALAPEQKKLGEAGLTAEAPLLGFDPSDPPMGEADATNPLLAETLVRPERISPP